MAFLGLESVRLHIPLSSLLCVDLFRAVGEGREMKRLHPQPDSTEPREDVATNRELADMLAAWRKELERRCVPVLRLIKGGKS